LNLDATNAAHISQKMKKKAMETGTSMTAIKNALAAALS
jgi:hypothetical protein